MPMQLQMQLASLDTTSGKIAYEPLPGELKLPKNEPRNHLGRVLADLAMRQRALRSTACRSGRRRCWKRR